MSLPRESDPRTPIGMDSRARRLADLLVAGPAALLLAPVLLAIALVVRASSAGPALFRQVRVGRGGRHFAIWKFRTMVVDAARQGPAVSGRADPRVTRVGRWLRATRLDELPQLMNLIRGDMTLIGPRPEVPRFLPYYTAAERALLDVRPGVIGPGAVLFAGEQSGELDGVEDADAFYVHHHLHPKLALDRAYLRDRRFGQDLRLIWAALSSVTRR
ncbi:sugar transferase [Pseudonocardia acidicola]|uniref:Sugar transferase n=1 Tax=Pseudonocardia acidicola TaxID=2724939 RepID=A0ABX1SPM8_9PSEU|nr:sugar transferase [Pseudonocardia acidicola]NMI02275.1 sugar transferase [Pseudonocardia acidicola]